MNLKSHHTWLFLAVVAFADITSAQKPSQPPTRLGVDVVSLRDGPQLFGAVTQRNENGLKLAVERSWLKKTYPKFFQQHVKLEEAEAIVAARKLKERIDHWKESRAGDENLVLFLDNEIQRLKTAWQTAKKNPPAPSQFVIVDLPADRIRSLYLQPAERKQIALLAWRERLERVTTRTTNNLAMELKNLGITLPQSPVDLSDRLPQTQLPTERSWAAKVAVVEYRLRKKVGFQGTGDFLARTGDGAAEVNLAEMMQVVLKQQIEQQLNALLQPQAPRRKSTAWLDKAIQEADKLEVSGFRVSRLDKDMQNQTVQVTSSFIARMPDDRWSIVWEHTQSRKLSDAKAAQKDQVANAPRITQMLALLKNAGIANAEQQIQEALSYGAVTKDALDDANEAFQEFASRYGSRVDSPQIDVPPLTHNNATNP